MTYEQVIKFFGSQAETARRLRVTKGAVSQWRSGVPVLRQHQIENLSGGKLKASGHAA